MVVGTIQVPPVPARVLCSGSKPEQQTLGSVPV